MNARFELEGHNRPVLVVVPDYGDEDILMAAFLRYDQNSLSVRVERRENGRIERVTFLPDQSN
jgi:hypothetical protein